VLQGYVIHLLAKEGGFFGAKNRSYGAARDSRSHLWLMGEVELADAIAGAVKSSGLSGRWTVCTAAFLRFALASASDDATWKVYPKLTPFRQIMAMAWSSVHEGMQGELCDIRIRAAPQGTEVSREQIAVLRSWLFFMQGYEGYQPSLGRLPPKLDRAVREALATAPIEPGERRPKRLIAAMVIHTFLRIVEGLRIDRLIDDPASLMPSGGFIYVAGVYQGAEPVGVKVGRTTSFPRREKQHRLASAGAVREFVFVRFVSGDVAAEGKLKAAMTRRFPRLKDTRGLALGNEWFACSIGDAKFVARHVLQDFEARVRGRSEADPAVG
jgi:T5orf172 domain